MGRYGVLPDLKVRSVEGRCQALLRSLDCFDPEASASPAVGHVVEGIRIAVGALRDHLDAFPGDLELDVFFEDELELKIHRVSRILPYLHRILGLVDRSDVSAVPAEISAPMQRHLQRFFPSAELFVVSTNELNYTIIELSEHLRRLLAELGCRTDAGLPVKVWRVSIPAAEYDQALLHGLIAHEMGHALYKDKRLREKIPGFSVDQDNLARIFSHLKENSADEGASGNPQTELPFDELQFRENVTDTVTSMLTLWIEELAADLFALYLFGPAYLCACIHFSVATATLDSSSPTHPPFRLRLKLLFEVLRNLYPDPTFSTATGEFLSQWERISAGQNHASILGHVAMQTLMDNKIMDSLRKEVPAGLDPNDIYTRDSYIQDRDDLLPLVNSCVPPVQVLREGGVFAQASLVGILNVGWEASMDGLQEFRTNLRGGNDASEFDIGVRFNRFLLKSMELSEIVTAWGEAQDDTVE